MIFSAVPFTKVVKLTSHICSITYYFACKIYCGCDAVLTVLQKKLCDLIVYSGIFDGLNCCFQL